MIRKNMIVSYTPFNKRNWAEWTPVNWINLPEHNIWDYSDIHIESLHKRSQMHTWTWTGTLTTSNSLLLLQ